MIRRFVFTLLAYSFIVCEMFSQKIILMEKEGGVYRIPCSVNGAKMKMIFDTGASNVSLSMSIAEYLLDNDYIKKEDIIGKGQALIADGSSVDTYHLILRDVEIDGLHLYDVEASISASQNAPLLLGQSAIQKLGKISIEGNKLIIETGKSKYSSTEIANLRKEIEEALERGNRITAVEKLEELKTVDSLSLWEMRALSIQYFGTGKYQESISAGLEYLKKGKSEKGFLLGTICQVIGHSYSQLKKYSDAEYYYKKSLEYSYNNNTEYEDIYEYIGDTYYERKNYDGADYYYKKGIDLSYKRIGCTIKDVEKGEIQDRNLSRFLWRMYFVYKETQQSKFAINSLKLSAQCGFDRAQEICNRDGIKYKIKTKKK